MCLLVIEPLWRQYLAIYPKKATFLASLDNLIKSRANNPDKRNHYYMTPIHVTG